MKIKILSGIQGAKEAKGVTVVVDVLRAATVAAYLLDQGVNSILPVATAEEAFNYKKLDNDLVLVGEDKGVKIPGFDMGNSPLEIKDKSLHNVDVVHRSSTGTPGMVNAKQATTLIFGSFVSLTAIKDYILKQNPTDVTIVPMHALEDELFAEYLKQELLGERTLTMEEIVKRLENHSECDWFLDPKKTSFPIEDFYLSLELDKFNFFPIFHNERLVKSDAI